MRKIMFVGRSESGKTTIMQAMKGKPITYHKTQYVNNFDVIIDTPGEYAETKQLSGALAVYGCEADIIGLLMSAIEPFSLYPPNVVSVSNREVVGVVTKCDHWAANPELAAEWLRLAGCKKIFFTSAYTGEGIAEILSYLKEPVDVLPWEVAKAEYDKLGFGPGESEKIFCQLCLNFEAYADEIRVRLAENQPQKQVQKDAESTFYKKGEFL